MVEKEGIAMPSFFIYNQSTHVNLIQSDSQYLKHTEK